MNAHKSLPSAVLERWRRATSPGLIGVIVTISLLCVPDRLLPSAPHLEAPPGNGRWPGVQHGPAVAVDVIGNVAYVSINSTRGGLALFDISDVKNPQLIRGYRQTRGTSSVHVNGTIAYIATYLSDYGVIDVLDVSNPAAPRFLAKYPTYARDLQVMGKYAYVATGRVLKVLDVSNPTNILEAGSRILPGATIQSLAIAGSYAYAINAEYGLQIVDITNPTNPVPVRGYSNSTCGDCGAVEVVDGTLYVATDFLQVFDITNPTNLTRKGAYYANSPITAIRIAGAHAYVLDTSYGLTILDVSNPTNIVRLGGYPAPGQEKNCDLLGNYLLLADSVGLQILDVTNPSSPVRVAAFNMTETGNAVQVAGDYAYVTDLYGLKVMNVSDPVNIVSTTNIFTTGRCNDVFILPPYAYVAEERFGLHVFDISEPEKIVRVGEYQTHGFARAVHVSGNHAYLLDSNNLHVVNVSAPDRIEFAGKYISTYAPRGIFVAGEYAYLAEYAAGLVTILDVRQPTNITYVSSKTIGGVGNVFVSGGLAYVAATHSGFHVLDVSNPRNIVLLSSYDTEGSAYDVYVTNHVAFVADGPGGLQVFDVKDPRRIVRLLKYPRASPIVPYRDFDDWVRSVAYDKWLYLVGGDLHVLPSLPNVHFSFRINAEADTPLTIEASTNVANPAPWAPIFSTNSAVTPIEFTDFNARQSNKFYRVRQP